MAGQRCTTASTAPISTACCHPAYFAQQSLYIHLSSIPPTPGAFARTTAVMKRNDVIAIIIIILFLVLALVSFGIYRLVHMARTQGTVTSSSSGSTSLAD
ncbi:hypothetical protein PG995_008460 [Apiospora arundinis]